MNVSLFDAAQSVREAINQVDPETGEIADAYASSVDLFRQKAVACVAYAIEECQALVAAKAMIKTMQERIDAREKRLDRFHAYVADCMKATGVTSIEHEAGLFSAKLQIGRDESVEIEEGAAFPPSLCNDPNPPTPSKTKIKAAIKAGEAVAGVRLVRKDRLTIG